MNLLDQEQNQGLNNNKEKKMTDNNMEIGTWTQLAESLYEFLNRRGTTIEYTFADMEVMVPKSTGADAPQARWNLNGSVRLRTWES